MRSTDLAPLFAKTPPELGLRQGVVIAWDSITGENVVRLGGVDLTDLPTLASTGTVLLGPGDVVGLLRYRSTWFVLGRIGVPGQGAIGIRAATVVAEESTTSASYTDLATPGPVLNDVLIGSTRRSIVFIEGSASVIDGLAVMSFSVTGASSIVAGGVPAPASIGVPTAGQVVGSISAFTVLTAADGLNQGLNTFTVKYGLFSTANGDPAIFKDRKIALFPF